MQKINRGITFLKILNATLSGFPSAKRTLDLHKFHLGRSAVLFVTVRHCYRLMRDKKSSKCCSLLHVTEFLVRFGFLKQGQWRHKVVVACNHNSATPFLRGVNSIHQEPLHSGMCKLSQFCRCHHP